MKGSVWPQSLHTRVDTSLLLNKSFEPFFLPPPRSRISSFIFALPPSLPGAAKDRLSGWVWPKDFGVAPHFHLGGLSHLVAQPTAVGPESAGGAGLPCLHLPLRSNLPPPRPAPLYFCTEAPVSITGPLCGRPRQPGGSLAVLQFDHRFAPAGAPPPGCLDWWGSSRPDGRSRRASSAPKGWSTMHFQAACRDLGVEAEEPQMTACPSRLGCVDGSRGTGAPQHRVGHHKAALLSAPSEQGKETRPALCGCSAPLPSGTRAGRLPSRTRLCLPDPEQRG